MDLDVANLAPGERTSSQNRSLLLVGAGLLVVVAIALLAPKVGAVGVGTFLALAVAVVATLLALRGGRKEGVRDDGRPSDPL